MVLRGRAHHRRPADVDLLDAFVDACARVDRLAERIQVDDDQFERGDPELLEGLGVLGFPKVGEQVGVHPRMQGLDAAVEHLGESREFLHASDRDRFLGNGFAVDPVETISTPASASPRARSMSPVLSYTLINAR